jgi:FkbM family methyltransferase
VNGAAKLREVADRGLDAIGQVAERWPGLAKWRSERFCEQAVRRIPEMAVEGAHGIRYFVRPQDSAIGAAIIRDGAFEPQQIATVLALLRDNGISITHLLDVGANIGTTTIEVLRQMPEVTGEAFEPDPTNFQLLQMNLIANGFARRVRTHQAAVGNVTGTITLELATSNFGDHRVRLPNLTTENAFDEATRRTISVPGVRLDDAASQFVDSSTLVFIDVQGLEGHVLNGARRVLQCCPPLVVELWPYGLDRASGRQLMFDELARYRRLYDINASPPRLVAHGELDALAASVSTAPTGHTDLLALA